MLKWILGILAVIIIVVAGTCYYGYKQLTGGGNSVSVTMAGSPERIFAAIATPDSMALWMTSSQIEGPFGRGLLVPGDTLRLRRPTMPGDSTREIKSSFTGDWVVREVNAPTLMVMEMVSDSGGTHRVVLIRRDSLAVVGDSTTLVTTFTSPMFDSLSTSVRDSSAVGSSVLSGANKIMLGAMRIGTEAELKLLKARVEGK
jgi:uncharacterized protein YndB with AHSA1/START domain